MSLFWTGPFAAVPFAGNPAQMIYAIPTDAEYSVMDTRSLAECAVPPGEAVVFSDVTIGTHDGVDLSQDGDYTLIASDPEETLSGATIAELAAQFQTSKPVAATRFSDVLYELWTEHADVERVRTTAPLMPDHALQIGLHLPPALTLSRPFDFSAAAWPYIQQELWQQYRRLLADAVAGRIQQFVNGELIVVRDFHQRWLTAQLEKFRLPITADAAARFIPPDLDRVEPLPHFSSFTDNFNVADNAVLTGQRPWTEQTGDFRTLSNQAQNVSTGADMFARCDTDLSTGDDSATYTATAVGGYPGAVARSASLTTEMMIGYFAGSGVGTQSVIAKVVTGSRTDISSGTNGPIAVSDTMTIECSGSNHTLKRNGAVAWGPVSDSAVSATYLRVGFFMYATGALALDDLNATDLGGGALTNLRRGREPIRQAVNRAATY